MEILLLILAFCVVFAIRGTYIFALKGNDGIWDIVSRAEKSRNPNRVLQSVLRIKLLFVELLFLGFAVFVTFALCVTASVRNTEVGTDWFRLHGLALGFGLAAVYLLVIISIRRFISNRIKKTPFTWSDLRLEPFEIVSVPGFKMVVTVSNIGCILAGIIFMIAVGAAIFYGLFAWWIYLLLFVALAALVLVGNYAFSAGGRFDLLLTISTEGIRTSTGMLFPWDRISGVDVKDGKVRMTVAEAHGRWEKETGISLDSSCYRTQTVRRLIELYRERAEERGAEPATDEPASLDGFTPEEDLPV